MNKNKKRRPKQDQRERAAEMKKHSDKACEMRALAREQAFAQFRATPFDDFVKNLAALFEEKASLSLTGDGRACLSKEAATALLQAKKRLEGATTPQKLIDSLNKISLRGKTLLEWLMSNDHANKIYSLDNEDMSRNPLEINLPDILYAPGMNLFEAEDQCVAARLKIIALALPPKQNDLLTEEAVKRIKAEYESRKGNPKELRRFSLADYNRGAYSDASAFYLLEYLEASGALQTMTIKKFEAIQQQFLRHPINRPRHRPK